MGDRFSMKNSSKTFLYSIFFWMVYLFCFGRWGYTIGLVFGLFAIGVFLFLSLESEWLFCLFSLPFMAIFKISAVLPSISLILYCIFIAKAYIKKRLSLTKEFSLSVLLFFTIQFIVLSIYQHSYTSLISWIVNIVFIITAVQVIIRDSTDGIVKFKVATLCFLSSVFLMSIESYFNPQIINMVSDRNTDIMLNGTLVSRFSGIAGDPNYYTQLLMVGMGMSAALFMKCKPNILEKAVFGFETLFLLFCGIQTYSKSFYLMLGIMVALVLWYFYKQHLKSSATIIILIVITPIVIYGFYYMSVNFIIPGVMQRVTSTVDFTSGRTVLWKAYINMLLDNPICLFFGAGMSNGRNLIVPYYGMAQAAHNGFLELIADAGIVGCILILLAFHHILIGGRKMINSIFILPVFAFLITSMALSFASYDTVCFVLPMIFLVYNEGNNNEERNITLER